jgi:signal peptidase II
MDRIYAIIASFGAAVLAVDQWSKHLTLKSFFHEGQTTSIFSWFNLTLVHNHGVAFGMFRGLPDEVRLGFLLALPPVVLFALWFFMVRKLPKEETLVPIALGLVLGGAIGNLIDRIRFGYVIDMIDWHYPMIGQSCIPLFYPMSTDRCHWPVFNVADSAITIAMALLIWDSVRKGRLEANKSSAKA